MSCPEILIKISEFLIPIKSIHVTVAVKLEKSTIRNII